MARPKSRKAQFVEAMQAADPRYKPHGRADLKREFYSRLDAMTLDAFNAYVAENAAFLGRMYQGYLDQIDDFYAEMEHHKTRAYRAQFDPPDPSSPTFDYEPTIPAGYAEAA